MCVKGRKAKCWHGNAGYSKHPAPAAPQIGSISSWIWWCSDYDRDDDDVDDNEDEDDDEDGDDDTWQGKEEKSRLADFTFCRPLPFLQFIHFPLGSSQSLSLSLILSLPVDLFCQCLCLCLLSLPTCSLCQCNPYTASMQSILFLYISALTCIVSQCAPYTSVFSFVTNFINSLHEAFASY